MNSLQLKKDIHWVGSLDPDLRVFDIIMQTEFGTTYNSYIVKGSEKIAIFETVKAKYFDSYIEKIKEIINPEEIDYIIVDHTEPDHAGSVEMLLKKAKKAKVVGSQAAIDFLKDIINSDFEHIVVNHGDILNLGNKTLKFISAPFLHWPDSIYTYLPEDKMLFTCDSFGSHYSFDKILFSEIPAEKMEDYNSALLYYYTAIFGPFKKYVLEAIEKIKDFDIEYIMPGHGPVLDKNPMAIVETYKKWSTENSDKSRKKIVIPYVAAYGYTEQLAEKICEGVESSGDFLIKKYNLNISNYNSLKNEILNEIYDCDGILFGTSTINGDALPPIWDLAVSLNPIVHGGKTASAFGSYGWSGEGVPNIIARLDQLRMKVADGYTIKFKPSISELDGAFEFGKNFAKYILEGKVPVRKSEDISQLSDLNPTGEVKKWRCLVCGEVFEGVLPPKVCPACGVGQELFEAVEEEAAINIASSDSRKIVIIGAGAAGIAAAESARARNKSAEITVISGEKHLPYYRPSVSEYVSGGISAEKLLLKPYSWYGENCITLILEKNVNLINIESKTITLSDDSKLLFDKLIIAAGARAAVPPILGSNMKNIFTLRTQSDADLIRNCANKSKTAVIVGGGVLGLETASELQKMGVEVSIIERESRIFPRQLDEEGSAILEEKIKKNGINVYKNHFAKKFFGENESVEGIELDTGKTIKCDMAVISAGIKANKELFAHSGIKVNAGILINEKTESSIKDIYACGDCAEFDGVIQGLWATAVEQGKVAGANAAGESITYSAVLQPVTFSGMNCELFSIGDIGADADKSYQVSSYNDSFNNIYKKIYFHKNIFTGGILIGDISKAASLIAASKNSCSLADLTKKIFK